MGRSHTELHFEMLTKSFGGRAKHKFCFATNWHQQARSGRASWGLAPVPSGTGVRVRFPPRPAVEDRALSLCGIFCSFFHGGRSAVKPAALMSGWLPEFLRQRNSTQFCNSYNQLWQMQLRCAGCHRIVWRTTSTTRRICSIANYWSISKRSTTAYFSALGGLRIWH